MEEKDIMEIDTAADIGADADENLPEGTPEENEKSEAYRVFNTREEFQECIDRALGKRLLKARQQSEELSRLRPLEKEVCSRLNVASLEEFCQRSGEDMLSGTAGNTSCKESQQDAERIRAELFELCDGKDEFFNPEQAQALLADERFLALVKSGLPTQQAWRALYLDSYVEKKTNEERERVIREIRLRGIRPEEDAVSGYGSFSASIDPKNLSEQQRQDIRERVRRGERVTF